MQTFNTSQDTQLYKLRLLITAIFAFILAFTILHTSSLTAHASNNAGGQSQGGGQTSGVSDGAGEGKTGYRMYVVDGTGNVISPVVDIVHQQPSYNIAYVNTRLGNGASSRIDLMPSDMPTPIIYTDQFEGNGETVRNWMISINDAGVQRGYTLIADYLGADVYTKFIDISTTQYLVLEPITWHDIFSSLEKTSSTGTGFYGTCYNWLDYIKHETTYPDGRFTRAVENKNLAKGFALERDQPDLGLVMPSSSDEYITWDNLGNQGYGIHLYWNNDFTGGNNMTHTWDSSTFPTIEGEPPLPPPTETDPSKLVYTIIKSYRLKNNGTLSHVTTTWRTQTVASIVIEDEKLNDYDKNYKVIGWKQSSSANFGITATNWNPPGIIGQTGTSKGTTTLDTSHKILYQCEPSLTV